MKNIKTYINEAKKTILKKEYLKKERNLWRAR